MRQEVRLQCGYYIFSASPLDFRFPGLPHHFDFLWVGGFGVGLGDELLLVWRKCTGISVWKDVNRLWQRMGTYESSVRTGAYGNMLGSVEQKGGSDEVNTVTGKEVERSRDEKFANQDTAYRSPP